MSLTTLYFGFLLVSLRPVLAQTQNVQFGQVSNLNGDMNLNTLIMPDNSKIETFSQKQQQILITQTTPPIPASQVMGSTGQPFVQLSTNSMTISTNGATDLVAAQIEMPIDPTMLASSGVSADNTFVAMLSTNRQAWVVMEGIKSVNTTDNTVRMVKLNTLDGEYMAIGRQTTETSNVLTPFTTQQNVNITGSGVQEVEYQDGFRMTIMANKPMTINTNVVNGISTSMLTGGAMSVNNYRYKVTTNLAGVIPNLNQMMAVMQLPLNANRLMTMATNMGAGANDSVSLGISQRGVLQNPGGASTGATLSGQKRAVDKRQSSETSSAADTTDTATAASADTAASATSDPAATSSTDTTASAASDPASATTATPASQQGSGTGSSNSAATQLLLSPTFTPISQRTVLDMVNGRVAVTTNSLDGEFIVTMGMAGQANTASVSPGQLPTNGQQPGGTSQVKRQSSSTQGVTVSMSDLKALAQSQKLGNQLDVMGMMQEMSQGQSSLLPLPKRKRSSGPSRMPYAI